MKIKKFFWDYLYFSRIERNGIVFLLVICLSVLFFPSIYGRFFHASAAAEHAIPPLAIDAQHQSEQAAEAPGVSVQLFAFNPNEASLDDFKALGLSEKTAKSILNYRGKGGKFRTPDDFSKIYTLSETDFNRLRPWIRLSTPNSTLSAYHSPDMATAAEYFPFDPNNVDETTLKRLRLPAKTIRGWLNYKEKGGVFRTKEAVKKLYALEEVDYQRILPYMTVSAAQPAAAIPDGTSRPITVRQRYTISAIDINDTEMEAWTHLPGIGAGWAKRILDWREKLGGFARVEQVAETRFLPDSVFQKSSPFFKIETRVFRKIDLNTATWEQLNQHPYIEAKHARWMIAYREQHGKYQSVDDLLKIIELKKDWLEKVRPYLTT